MTPLHLAILVHYRMTPLLYQGGQSKGIITTHTDDLLRWDLIEPAGDGYCASARDLLYIDQLCSIPQPQLISQWTMQWPKQ